MASFIIWITTILVLVGVFFLTKYIARKYYDSKKGRYDSFKSNYISALGITGVLSAFIVLNPKTNQYLLNILIHVLNRYFNLNINQINIDIGIYDLLFYLVLCAAIAFIIYQSYKHRVYDYQKYLVEKKINSITESKIKFPKQDYTESPYLHERLKELFELKFKKYNLSLKETVSSENNKILYGSYEDDFNTIFEIIYCETEKKGTIKQPQIDAVLHILEGKFSDLSVNKNKPIPHLYFISENAKFINDISQNRMICQNEDDYINTLIDFKNYLLKLISRFENEKIFSALLDEVKKKSLAETYIEPLFYIGENKTAVKISLLNYVKTWLDKSNDNKHLVVLGDYGMGKTSFIKQVSASLAKEIINDGKIARFPVFIQLTNTSPIHGGIHSAIKSFVAENLGVEYELFSKLVEKGKVLFLLDAYDEMGFIGTNQQRFKQFNEIWQLATKNNKILLTGRPSYFPTEFELKSTLAIPSRGHEIIQVRPYAERIVLKKLEDAQIGQYIEKYYPSKGQLYLRWIRNNSQLHELCKRPSMMHIIREMLPNLYDESSPESTSAGAMMKQYIEYWVNRQDGKKIQSAFEGNIKRKLDFITNFFTDLSVELYLSNKTKMNSEEIIKILNASISFSQLSGFDNPENLEGFQQEILAGYFIEREHDSYKFAHKSFYEYFVASKIIELIKKREFQNPLMFKNWNLEIIDFIYDTIPEAHRNNENIPGLLSFANGKLLAKFKLFLFKLNIVYQSFMARLIDFILLLYLIPLTSFVVKYLLSDNTNQNSKTSGSVHESHNTLTWVVVIIILVVLFFYLVNKLDKVLRFTTKCIIINISKNKSNSSNFIKWIFGIRKLTIKLYNINISNIYFAMLRTFEESELENITFSDCNLGYTRFHGSHLHNIKFENVSYTKLKFVDCQLNNVDFNGLNRKRPFSLNLFFLINNIITNIGISKKKEKRKNEFDEVIILASVNPEQIDEYTINSLKKLITKDKLIFNKSIFVDDWLKELLTNEIT